MDTVTDFWHKNRGYCTNLLLGGVHLVLHPGDRLEAGIRERERWSRVAGRRWIGAGTGDGRLAQREGDASRDCHPRRLHSPDGVAPPVQVNRSPFKKILVWIYNKGFL